MKNKNDFFQKSFLFKSKAFQKILFFRKSVFSGFEVFARTIKCTQKAI